MPRPRCCRRIGAEPPATGFRPIGQGKGATATVEISLDEFEAMRLADLEGLYHEDAATRMQVSRATFGRIIGAVRHKIADALAHGKALQIGGGTVHLGSATADPCRLCDRLRSGGPTDCSLATPSVSSPCCRQPHRRGRSRGDAAARLADAGSAQNKSSSRPCCHKRQRPDH